MLCDGDAGLSDTLTVQEMNRRAHAAVAELRAEASRLAGAGASRTARDLPKSSDLFASGHATLAL